MMSIVDDMLIFKGRKQATGGSVPQKPAPAVQAAAPAEAVKDDIPPLVQHETGTLEQVEIARGASFVSPEMNAKALARAKKAARKEQVKSAVKEHCVWHPWRPAYAICDYCHRPFCFEDLVEAGGLYYCLEDIDTAIQTLNIKGDEPPNYAFIAGLALTFMFVVFFYFNGITTIQALFYAKAAGPIMFASFNYGYDMPLVGFTISILAFLAGISIFREGRAAKALGFVFALFMLLFALYDYTVTAPISDLVLAFLAASALVMLISSTYAYEPILDEMQDRPRSKMTEWSNMTGF